MDVLRVTVEDEGEQRRRLRSKVDEVLLGLTSSGARSPAHCSEQRRIVGVSLTTSD